MTSGIDHLFIYGPPGSGKSTLARALAERLVLPHVDLDERIEQQTGLVIPQIFANEGEAGFRKREREALMHVLAEEAGVVSLGGGALLDEYNRSLVEAAGPVLCLSASFETLLVRTRAQAGRRPLIHGNAAERLQALMEKRFPHYASFERQVETDGKALDLLTWEAQVALGAFQLASMGAGYDVRVASGGLDHLGEALLRRGLNGPVAVVSDDNVAPLYAERALYSLRQAGYLADAVIIPAGETHKNIETVGCLWETLLRMGLERSSTVVALGGGVVGDLAGFSAATYLRGVRWVAIPCSLLAMVDASLGGKTGADLPQGKNLVGAFHPPSLVLVDPKLLTTLPEVELRNGLAEVVKHGVIGDPLLFDLCHQGWDVLGASWEEVVRRAMAVKVRVIEADPFEKGERASLNLGHTLGHALEQVSDYRLRHGEAVAIGMVVAARLAEKMRVAQNGLAEEIAATLSKLGLPTEVPANLEREHIIRAMSVDKKRKGGQVRWVLPVRLGEVRWGIAVEDLQTLLDM